MIELSLLILIITIVTGFFKTKTFIDFLEKYVLNGVPKKVSEKDIELINKYLINEEIRVNNVLSKQPKLVFEPYTHCEDIINDIDAIQAKKNQIEQLEKGFPDDPHIFAYKKTGLEKLNEDGNEELHAYVIGKYSELRTLPKDLKHRILVIGANNLALHPKTNEFIFHYRGPSETESGKLHGFGGGYMPYWEDGNKTLGVRRDDCKNLRYTAMREMHEESGILSLDHMPSMVSVIEERHTNKYFQEEGKFGYRFGYLTFFYITLVDQNDFKTYGGDPKEGHSKNIKINGNNLRKIIINKEYDGMKMHSQLIAMLLLWFFAGCPGLHFVQRRRLSNIFTRYKMRKEIS